MDSLLLIRPAVMTKYERNYASQHFRIEESRVLCANSLVVGRYSVRPFYEGLDRDLRLIGSRLINTCDEHNWIATFAYYRELREFTPETWDESNIAYCGHPGPFVVKGKLSSKKWKWNSHMFAETKSQALQLAERLKEDGEIYEQGVVFRRYVPLKAFEIGPTGLPFTNEWRFYYHKTTLLTVGYYWGVGEGFRKAVLTDECRQLAQHIAGISAKFATFFTLDLAETAEGDWILIELNEGQMAVPAEHDLDELYGRLKTVLG